MPEKSRMEMIQDLLKTEPNDEFLNYGLALEYKSAGRLDDALAQFRRLVDVVNPKHSQSYLQLGQLLSQMNRTDEARAVYTRGIDVAQKNGDFHPRDEMRAFLAELD